MTTKLYFIGGELDGQCLEKKNGNGVSHSSVVRDMRSVLADAYSKYGQMCYAVVESANKKTKVEIQFNETTC